MARTIGELKERQRPEIPGYQLWEILGEGALSEVYRATHEGTTQDVAIKIMRPIENDTTAAAETRFRQEAAALARLDHRRLVRILEAGYSDRPYLVMELLDGETLSKAIEAGPFSEQRIIEMARALAEGLVEVHRHGLVHRDLKPSNVMITRAGEPKIIDFGFAAREETDEAVGNEIVGTFLYSSPEQTRVLKRSVDNRSDLYSLGCILFECAIGRPPFDADELSELFRQHAAVKPEDIHQLRSEVRPLLAEIVAKLLEKDPDDRYQTARGLLTDLEELTEIEAARKAKQERPLGAKDAQYRMAPRVPLIGREREMEAIDQTWSQARHGVGAILQIEGEGGSGKTRLLRELTRRADDDGVLVLSGKAHKTERTPFGPLREAIDSYLAKRRAAEERAETNERLLQAAGANAAIVKRLSKGLSKSFGEVPDIPPLAPSAEQERFYQKVAQFFAELAQIHNGMIIVIDDIQWLDNGSLEIFKQLVNWLPLRPLLMATTARNNPESEKARAHFVAQLGEDKIERIVLEPLSRDAVGELVAAHLGGRKMDQGLVERLATRANGNPFALGEYIHAMLEQGMLTPTPSGWRADIERIDRVVLAGDVLQVLVGRVATLAAETERVLCCAAVLGFIFEYDLLVKTTDDKEGVVDKGLAQAVQANLIEEQGGSFSFVHDRVQEALLEKLSEEELRDIHQSAARALDQLDDINESIVFRLADHYAKGHTDDHEQRVYDTSLAAGKVAQASFSNEESFLLLERAMRFAQRLEIRGAELRQLQQALGLSCSRTGRLQEAKDYFQEALKTATDDDERARLHYLTSLALSSEGKNEDAWDECQIALGSVGAAVPNSRVLQVAFLFWYWLLSWFLLKTGFGFGRAKKEARARRQAIALMYNSAYFVAYYMGDQLRTGVVSFQRLVNGHYLGTSRENAKALVAHAISLAVAVGMLMHESIKRYAARAVAIAEQLGDDEALTYCLIMEGYAIAYSGDSVRGEELVRKSLPRALQYSIARDAGLWIGAVGISKLQQGRARESVDTIREWLPVVRRMGVIHYVSSNLGGMFAALSILGRAREGLPYKLEQDRLAEELPNIKFIQAFRYAHTISALYEQGSFGRPLEDAIEGLLNCDYTHYLLRYAYLVAGYVRLDQLMRAEGHEQIRSARQALIKMIRTAAYGPPLRGVLSPVHRCHIYVLRAALAREEKRYRRCKRLLNKAERDARTAASPWGLWAVHRERARLAQQRNDEVAASMEAERALKLALEEGWTRRAERIDAEFALSEDAALQADMAADGDGGRLNRADSRFMTGSRTFAGRSRTFRGGSRGIGGSRALSVGGSRALSIGASQGTSSSHANLTTHRYFEALLEVSLAASTSLDTEQQCTSALDALIRVIGAERAFIFLGDDHEHLQMTAGRDQRGQNLKPLTGYSSTVVKLVHKSAFPLVVTGTDEGEALGSESAVAHDLRSIMAAPLIGQEGQCLGVVYTDSSMMKGLFTDEDLEMLQAIGNQIAISINTSRLARDSARLQAAQSVLKKEIELTAAVQALCMPSDNAIRTHRFELSGYYRPAEKCGGDWWWYEELPDSKLAVLVGDVTGHGIASAMISASVASTYRSLRKELRDADVPSFLPKLSDTLLEIGGTRYHMTMAALTLDGQRNEASLAKAGAPPVLLMRKDGNVEVLNCLGAALGMDDFSFGLTHCELHDGDRLFVFTDGIMEAERPNGRMLGLRGLRKLLLQSRALDVRLATQAIIDGVDAQVSQIDDDATFILVDVIEQNGAADQN